MHHCLVHTFNFLKAALISDEVTGGGAGAAILESPVTSKEVIHQAEKVSGHLREGQKKPSEVTGNPRNESGNQEH
jgi:hypothetical protein